jgi:hypothetical protein
MANVQQPEMRRSGETRLVQDSDGPTPEARGSAGGGRREHRPVPPDQVSPYGPDAQRAAPAQERT